MFFSTSKEGKNELWDNKKYKIQKRKFEGNIIITSDYDFFERIGKEETNRQHYSVTDYQRKEMIRF